MKLNKKFISLAVALLTMVGFLTVCGNTTQAKSIYSATYWGASKKVTVPKKLRGTWYYLNDNDKLTKIRFTTHTFNKAVIYKDLSDKKEDRYFDKFEKLPLHKQRSLFTYFDKHALVGLVFTWHGKTGIDIHSWLVRAGGGAQYIPVTRKINGKRVKAIRIGGGAYDMLDGYAYKTKALALKHKN